MAYDTIQNGGNGNDTLTGYDDSDDLLNGGAGRDWLDGLSGDDQLSGGADDDWLYGGAGNDNLIGGGGMDTLVGGAGDDVQNGGGHADTFVFDFDYTPGTLKVFNFADYLVANGKGNLLADGPDGKEIADGLAQSQWPNLYHDWLNWLVGQGVGEDGADANSTVDFAYNQNTGTTSIEGMAGSFSDLDDFVASNNQTRKYQATYTEGQAGSLTSGDGHDLIKGFDWAEDHISFGDVVLDQAAFAQYFKVSVADADGDGLADDTVLSLKDDSWSVAIQDDAGVHGLVDFHVNIFGA